MFEVMHVDMDHYYNRLRESALNGFTRLDQSNRLEERSVHFTSGRVDASVSRGKVLGKAATARIQLTTKNPETGEQTHFNVFQIKVYPVSPKIPILLFNMENRVAKDDRFAGFLDVAPVATAREDINCMQQGIKNIAERYGQDYERLRKKVVDIYKRDHKDTAVNAGIGIRLELSVDQFDLVSEAGLKWLDLYFAIVGKRCGEPCHKADEMLMYNVRSRITEFYLLKDISFKVIQKLGVPLQLMALIHFPPTLRY